MAFDDALRQLLYTEKQLKDACNKVQDSIPATLRQAAGIPVSGSAASLVSDDHETTGRGLARGQMSGRRDRPDIPRRRFLSTVCEHCKDREREIGMEESAPQVGRCIHGVEDELVEEEDDQVYYEDDAGNLSFVEDTGVPSDFQGTRRTRGQGLPTVLWLQEQVAHITNLGHKVEEYQVKVLSLSVWTDDVAETEARAEARSKVDYWLREVKVVKDLVTQVI